MRQIAQQHTPARDSGAEGTNYRQCLGDVRANRGRPFQQPQGAIKSESLLSLRDHQPLTSLLVSIIIRRLRPFFTMASGSLSSLDLDTPEAAQTYSKMNKGVQLVGAMRLLKKYFPELPGSNSKILDIGCGTGDFIFEVIKLLEEEGKVFASDPLPERIKLANQALFKLNLACAKEQKPFLNVTFSIDKAENVLDVYGKSFFEYVTMISVIHWLNNSEDAARQAYEVLKPGGYFGVTTGCRGETTEAPQHPLLNLKQSVLAEPEYAQYSCPSKSNPTMFTEDNLRSIMNKAGFERTEIDRHQIELEFDNYEEFCLFMDASSYNNFTRADFLPEEKREGYLARMRSRYREIIERHGAKLPVDQFLVCAYK
jgi:ubiquinone/menaquinone biosynthesis C-methylase UbiE